MRKNDGQLELFGCQRPVETVVERVVATLTEHDINLPDLAPSTSYMGVVGERIISIVYDRDLGRYWIELADLARGISGYTAKPVSPEYLEIALHALLRAERWPRSLNVEWRSSTDLRVTRAPGGAITGDWFGFVAGDR